MLRIHRSGISRRESTTGLNSLLLHPTVVSLQTTHYHFADLYYSLRLVQTYTTHLDYHRSATWATWDHTSTTMVKTTSVLSATDGSGLKVRFLLTAEQPHDMNGVRDVVGYLSQKTRRMHTSEHPRDIMFVVLVANQ